MMLQHCGSVVWHCRMLCGMVRHGIVWCGVVWCGVVWCGVVWCGVMWHGMAGVAWCCMSGVLCHVSILAMGWQCYHL